MLLYYAFSALIEFIGFCNERVKTGKSNVSVLISHGLDLVSMLMPIDNTDCGGNTTNVEHVKQFMVSFSESVEKLSGTSSLLLLKTSCEILIKCLPTKEHCELQVGANLIQHSA